MSEDDRLDKAAVAFLHANDGKGCVLCDKPAHDVGAFLPNPTMAARLRVSPLAQPVFFYMVCRRCVTKRGKQVQTKAERQAMATTAGLSVENN
jgi:hypothetical protein